MKKSLTTLLLFFVVFSGFSQLRVGLLGGPSSSSITEKNSLPNWETSTKPFYTNRNSFHIGFMLQMPVKGSRHVFFQPGFLYSNKGNKYFQTRDTSSYQQKDSLFLSRDFFTSYIDVPLNFAYKFYLGKKSSFMISAGPYASFFYSGKETYSTRTFQRDSTLKPDTVLAKTLKFVTNESKLQVGKGAKKVSTFDFGVNVRIGFDFGKVFVTGFYSHGLTNFYEADYDGTFKNKVFGGSLGFWLNNPKPEVVPPKDRDKDGIIDKEDACPTEPGPAVSKGCPDQDEDGVADKLDKCRKIPGVARHAGCPIPDNDKDGVNDEADKCPTVPGLAKYNGCPVPDTDKDGIGDEEDMCPDKAGPVEFNGCPIPDSDGDGLNDKNDKCPLEKGPESNNGCPEIRKEIIEKVNYTSRNIFFDYKSDVLLQSSFAPLNELAKILAENADLNLLIEGHTDNIGNPAYNLSLSQKRADAVKKYLIGRGIDSSRLRAVGLGQEKPIAENKTKEGQARNRRVELKPTRR